MTTTKINEVITAAAEQALAEAEYKLKKSCAQITSMNRQLEDMTKRYVKAKNENFQRFRYNLRLKLAVVEGVRNMYYEYAFIQATNVADLRRRLYGEDIRIVDDAGLVEQEETS
jgi:ABC-type phosphate transport system auxiliary subunit